MRSHGDRRAAMRATWVRAEARTLQSGPLPVVPQAAALCENRCLHTERNYRLLVVRLGAMGDILHALPAVTALRRAHPEWRIDWVVEPRWRELLEAPAIGDQGSPVRSGRGLWRPVVDGIFVAAVKEWGRRPLSGKTLGEIRELRRALRAGGYDAAIDFQGAVRSAAIARMAGARRVVGEAEPREWVARWLFTERVATRGKHVIEQDVEVARAVAGDGLECERPLLPVDPEAERWCDGLLGAGGGAVVLMNPGAGWGAKRWPPERYGAVARGLAERGMRVLVNRGPGEEELAEVVVRACAGGAQAVAPTLGQLIALTRRAALAVGGDSGPLHLACALGVPVVGIYGPTDPTRNGPFGTRARVLRSPLSRRDHTRRAAPEAGLLTIAPEEALRAAGELLDAGMA